MFNRFYIKNTLLVVFVLLSVFCHGQFSQRYKLHTAAEDAFEFGDYLKALELYNKLYLSDSLDSDINLKLGICNYEIKKYRHLSKKYFDKVNATDFPEVNYYLGRLSHSAKQYDKAIFHFNQYKYFGADNEYSSKTIEDLIKKCHNAKYFESNADKTIKVKNLGGSINTPYPEYAPLIPAQENFIIFTSRRKNDVYTQTDPLGDYFEDVYLSYKHQDKWQTAAMLDTVINTNVHDAGTGLSADGEKLLIYRTSKDLKSGDIYESYRSNNNWSAPTLLGNNVNSSEFLETSACYSSDGETVFFSSNRPGGYGGKDLYLARILPNGKWGEPFNLGPLINTEYNEDAPFIHPTGDILYFSSEGHNNMGGYDIFKSDFLPESSQFSIPQNLGCPVNTVDDDIFFVLNTDASMGYFSSEREEGMGSQDIYSVFFPVNNIPLYAYNIHVYDESGNIINKVEITLNDPEDKKLYGIYKSNAKTGKLLVITKPKKQYSVNIRAEGYKPAVATINFNTEFELSLKVTEKINE